MDCRGGEEYREEDQWGGGPPHKSLGKGKGMGMKMNYLSLVLSPSKQARRRGVDSTAKGSKIGCLLAPLLFVLEVDVLAICTN